MAKKKIKFFTGAPLSSQLDLVNGPAIDEYLPEVKTFLGLPSESSSLSSPPATAISNWRVLPRGSNPFYETPVLRNGKVHDQYPYASPFKDDHDKFLVDGFDTLDNLQSSQIAPQRSPHDDDYETTFMTTTSFVTSTFDSDLYLSSLDSTELKTPAKQSLKISGPITNIKSLPSASHLLNLRPQTMTVNLVAGVISILPSKFVNVRKGNFRMEVVEILVGDDTKAGFSISTWLLPEDTDQGPKKDELRRAIRALRPGNVIVIQQVALHVFQNTVFGQSLNRRTTNNVTRFAVIDSDAMSSPSLSSSIDGKIRRVKDWVDAFIGPTRKRQLEDEAPRKGKKTAKAIDVEEEYLPPDTQ